MFNCKLLGTQFHSKAVADPGFPLLGRGPVRRGVDL